MPNLTVAISAHGYGHAAQVSPVVEALASMVPNLRVMLHSDLPAAILRQFFPMARGVTTPLIDLGMRMTSTFDVNRRLTADLYTALHVDFARSTANEAERLARSEPSLILSNVSYLALAAARRMRIPSVALSSLNWYEMYGAYCGDMPDAPDILDEMLDAYRSASLFITPTPSMPMPDLETRPVGPVARLAPDDARTLVDQKLGLGPQERVVLVGLGGIAHTLPLAQWPAIPNVRFIVATPNVPDRRDMVTLDSLKLDYLDCLAGSDALVTKPGYGSVVEAACHGIPVIYAARGDWPEEDSMLDWLHEQGNAVEITREDLGHGNLADALDDVWAQDPREPVNPIGNLEAADLIKGLLR
jgi:hypothetical protein